MEKEEQLGNISQNAGRQVWAAFKEAIPLAKVRQDAELMHCRVPPRCCHPLPGLCEQRCGARVSLGCLRSEGSWGL